MIERDLVLELKTINQRIGNIMQLRLDKCGLSLGLLYLMHMIENNPDTNQKQLAGEMRLTQGAMSISIKKLMELGMVDKEPLEEDLRHHRLVLTDKGKKVIDDYEKYLEEIIKDIFTGFTLEELKKFSEFTSRINDNLKNIMKKVSKE